MLYKGLELREKREFGFGGSGGLFQGGEEIEREILHYKEEYGGGNGVVTLKNAE